MRWFKHMTHSFDDEKLSRLVDACGLEGYGFWWRVVEIVASFVDEKGHTSVTLPPKKWGSLLGISPKKFKSLAEFCRNFELLLIKNSENEFTVSIPNILKFRDEWSRKKGKNSGATPEQLRSKETDTDTEKEEDKTTPPTPPPSAKDYPPPQGDELGGGGDSFAACREGPKKTDSPSKGTPEWSVFLSCWEIFPVHQGQEDAWREWMRLKENGVLEPAWVIRDAILRLSGEDSRWKRGKVPKMAKWLSGKGWNDEPFVEPEQNGRGPVPPLSAPKTPEAKAREQAEFAEWTKQAREKTQAELEASRRMREKARDGPNTAAGVS